MNYAYGAAAVLLLITSITDLKRSVIPNRLTIPFFVAGLLFHFTMYGFTGVFSAITGAVAGFLPLLLLYAANGIGAGDVKLFGAIGAWIGAGLVLQLMLYAILYAGVIAVGFLIWNKAATRRVALAVLVIILPYAGWSKEGWLQWTKGGKTFPFMLAVIPAAVTVWFILLGG